MKCGSISFLPKKTVQPRSHFCVGTVYLVCWSNKTIILMMIRRLKCETYKEREMDEHIERQRERTRGACPLCLRQPCSGSVWDAHPHSLWGINRTEPLTRLSISLIIKHLSQYVPQARLITGEEVHRATHSIMGDSERGQIRKEEHLPTGLLQDLLTEVCKDSYNASHVFCFKSKFRCVCMQVCLSLHIHACFYGKGLLKNDSQSFRKLHALALS